MPMGQRKASATFIPLLKIILTFIGLFWTFRINAQCTNTFRLMLSGSGNEFAYDAVEIAGGDIIIAGQTTSFGSGGIDLYLTRLTRQGTLVWSKAYGGNQNEFIRKINLANDGEILVTGQTKSFGNVNGDGLAMKVDLNGNIRWATKLSEANTTILGLDIIPTSDNGFAVCGTSYALSAAADWVVVKLDASGNLIWTKKFDNTINEDPFSLMQKNDTLIVVGDAQTSFNYLGVITKMSVTTGQVYTSRGFTSDNRGSFACKIKQVNNSYRIAVDIIDGNSYSQRETGYIFTDLLFNPVKSFKQIAVPNDNHYFSGFWITSDGGFIATGSPATASAGYLYKYDALGNLIFTRKFSAATNAQIYSAIEAVDGSIWVVGSENNHALVLKVDALGNFENCPNQPIVRNTQSITYVESAYNWPSIVTGNFINPTLNPVVTGFSFTINASCLTPICLSLKITGQDTVCNTTDTLTYLSHTQGSCGIIRNWIIPIGVNSQIINDSTIRLNFPSAGTFNLIAQAPNSCNPIPDTMKIVVRLSPTIVFIGNDRTLCSTSPQVLDAGSGFQSYLWHDNSTAQTHNATLTGTYYVTAKNYCGQSFSDTIHLIFRNPSNASVTPVDTSFCVPGPIQLKATGGDIYTWSPPDYLNDPNISSPVSTTPFSNNYQVQITDTVCMITNNKTVRIFIDPVPVFAVAKSNDVDCTIGTAQLVASGSYSFQWSPSSSLNNPSISNPIAIPTQTTTYKVIAANSLGCKSEDSVTVIFTKAGNSSVFMPNAFTPNDNGKNDVFRVRSYSNIRLEYFSVYNRWGERIFTTSDVSKGWDGKVKGVLQTTGVYVWMVKGSSLCSGDIFMKGTVVLIR